MKKRIIALLMVVVLCVSVLAGCAYDYEKEDLTKYSTADGAAMKAAFRLLEIEDGTFTTDKETREKMTLAKLASAFAEAVKKLDDRKLTDGVILKTDLVEYYFYLTTEKDGKTYTYSTENMKLDKATAVQLNDYKIGDDVFNTLVLGLLTLNNGEIDLAVNGFKTETSGDLPKTGLIFLSYTTEKTTGGNSTKSSVTNVILDLSDDTNELVTALKKREGVKIGTKFATGSGDDAKIEVTADETTTSYYDITITWAQTAGKDFSAPLKGYYTSAKNDMKDMYNNTFAVDKDTEITVHVFPSCRYAVADPADKAAAVREQIFTVLGAKNLKTTSLELFESKDYFYTTEGEGAKTVTLADIIKELVDNYADYSKKEEAKNEAQKAYDKEKTEGNKAALDTATAEYEAAKAKVNPDTVMAEIEKCKKGDEGAVDAIYEAIHKAQFDSLESEYNAEIVKKVKKAAWAAIKKNITVNSVPKGAVDDAYDQNMKSYKYDYYSSSDNKSKYATLDDYLMKVATDYLGKDVTTKNDMKSALRAQAEEQAKDMMTVYIAAKALREQFPDDNLNVTKDEINKYAENIAQYSYLYYLYGISKSYYTTEQVKEMYGDANLRTEILMQKILNLVAATVKDSSAEDFGGSDAIDFKNVSYTIKAAEKE